MRSLYPLKFVPIFKDKIWGGTKIKTVLGKDFSPLPHCGEMWVMSGVEGDETEVSHGFLQGNTINELVEVYMEDLVGEKVFNEWGEVFPLLIKFIDTNDYLSIQVHPDDELALKKHGMSFGKTEMWVVLESGPDAELISGFQRDVTEKEYLFALEQKSLKELLNVEKVVAGDYFFIPAGRVHAIGPDILLAEIQQTSDITYRIYDWDRLGLDGLPRELHTEDALEAIDFSKVRDAKGHLHPILNTPSTVVQCPQFTTNSIQVKGKIEIDHVVNDSFMILLCLDGSFDVPHEEEPCTVSKGEAVLIPAEMTVFQVISQQGASVLQIFM
jgi:mannose-6-phosphate isomerase